MIVGLRPGRRITCPCLKPANGREVLQQLLRKLSIALIVDECCRGTGNTLQFGEDGSHRAFRGARLVEDPFRRVRARSCRNTNGNQITCFHDAFPVVPEPTVIRHTSGVSGSMAIGTSRNRRMTLAFVTVCDVGVNVLNEPPPANAIGMSN